MFYNLRLISFGLFQFLFFILSNFSLSSFFIGYGTYHVLPWTANIQNEFTNSISEKLHVFSTYVPENYLNFNLFGCNSTKCTNFEHAVHFTITTSYDW